MKIRTSWRRTAALLAAGALFLTACSSDDDTGDDTATEEPADDATEDATEEDMDDEEAMDDDMAEVATDAGVTEEPCPEEAPETVNADNGCIYLGVISDLTQGPFAAAGPAITDAQIAFWTRVNEEGGIGGAYDVNISENVRDNLYNPETHNQVYQEIKPDILALAQSLGSPTTQAIADDLESSDIVAVPASWTSANEFQSFILESGNNYCVESSNGLDFYVEQNGEIGSVLAVHLPGDYGWDGAAGAQKWAAANGATFANVQVTDSTDAAVAEIGNTDPDVVIITLGPTDTAEVVGGAVGRGYDGFFIGNSPTWNPALLASAAGPAFEAYYWQAAPWGPYDSDTPGHQAMRDQLEAMADELDSYDPAALSDFFTAGWAWSYPLEAALQSAYEAGDITRAGVAAAAAELDAVDYEGFLPAEAGDFTGEAVNQSFDGTWVAAVDPESTTGVSTAVEDYRGPTAAEFPFDEPCYVEEGFGG
jgi:hypothetical protein